MKLFSPKPKPDILKVQLLEIIDLLDIKKIDYYLEGGTLLGCVREGRLLPWDHDTDISIMSENIKSFEEIISIIPSRWKVSFRYFEKNYSFAKKGELRLIKIKDRYLHFMSGANTLDVFIKFKHDDKVYWEAAGNIMAVDYKYYSGVEHICCFDKNLSIPKDYEKYLTEKYGDWSKPVKQWHCSQEQTIVIPKGK